MILKSHSSNCKWHITLSSDSDDEDDDGDDDDEEKKMVNDWGTAALSIRGDQARAKD